MSIAIVCTGTELLKGGCCNTDLRFAGAALAAAALPPVLELSVGDHADELCFALSCALKAADTVIVSGGLGPTSDDITLATVAGFFGAEMIEVPELRAKIESFWRMRHRGHCPKNQYKQAMAVRGGEIFPNRAGAASGIGFTAEYGGRTRRIYLLPGPPAEFEAVLEDGMLAAITAAESGEKRHTAGFLICGIGESAVAAAAEPFVKNLPLEIAYTAVSAGTKLFLTGADRDTVAAAAEELRKIIGRNALEIGQFDLPSALLARLLSEAMTLGCAESCTGGLAADSVVSLPGASRVFRGGIVSYANEVKTALLGVPEELLRLHGAVSAQCAEAMAEGACAALRCDCAVSTTGIAGPDGGTPEKPVGLVYVGAACRGVTAVRELHLRGTRQMIRERAVSGAWMLLRDLLDAGGNLC